MCSRVGVVLAVPTAHNYCHCSCGAPVQLLLVRLFLPFRAELGTIICDTELGGRPVPTHIGVLTRTSAPRVWCRDVALTLEIQNRNSFL